MIHLTDQLDSAPKSASASLPGVRQPSPLPVASKMVWYRRVKRSLDRNGTLMLMALPGLVLLFLFHYLPLPGLVIAFKNYKTGIGI